MGELSTEVKTYFDNLIKTQLPGAPIICGSAGSKGKAIFADRALCAGEPIWTELPFVAMQHEDNKGFIDCCENCFVSLINSQDAWGRVYEALEDKSSVNEKDFWDAIDILQKEGGKSAEESYFNVFKLGEDRIKCECGAIYCSQSCKDAAYREHHALLCPRINPETNTDEITMETHPMSFFLQHTQVTNEIFYLAAKVIAKIVLKFIALSDLTKAREPVDMFCKRPWWDVIVSQDDVKEGQTMEEYKDCFRNLLLQTFTYFMHGLLANLKHLESEQSPVLNGMTAEDVLVAWQETLTVDFLANIVGMFEMNNISMEIDHPFHALGEALAETEDFENEKEEKPEEPSKSIADQRDPVAKATLTRVRKALETFADKYQHPVGCGCGEGKDDDHNHDHDDDATVGDFVGVEGTALFSGICTMNHSCDPNCTVVYTKDGAAHVFAVHDIKEGEELCISYVDVDQAVDDRNECLREYQFTCACARCEEERNS